MGAMNHGETLTIEVKKEGIAPSIAFILLFFLFIAIIEIVYFRTQHFDSQGFSEYAREPIFWLILFLLFGSVIVPVSAQTLYRYHKIRRFDRVYVFSDQGVLCKIARKPEKMFTWDQILTYSILGGKLFNVIDYIFKRQKHLQIEFRRKLEVGTMFSNTLFFIDVPQEQVREIVRFLNARNVAQK